MQAKSSDWESGVQATEMWPELAVDEAAAYVETDGKQIQLFRGSVDDLQVFRERAGAAGVVYVLAVSEEYWSELTGNYEPVSVN